MGEAHGTAMPWRHSQAHLLTWLRFSLLVLFALGWVTRFSSHLGAMSLGPARLRLCGAGLRLCGAGLRLWGAY